MLAGRGPIGEARAAVWQAIYDSPLHHPGIAWLALAVAAALFASRERFLYGYLAVLGLAMAADALASSPFVKIPGSLGTAVAVAFVIVGDFRLFLVTERCAAVPGSRAYFGRALALSLVVPLLSTAVRLGVPVVAATARLQFLVYEALFVVLAVGYRVTLSRRLAAATPEVRRWALGVTTFVLVQYALWALADVLVLARFEPGLALRLVPNIMYYALFLPTVYLLAPSRERSPTR